MRPLLDGVRVVEFSQLIAAPFAGLTLLDLGAEVVKVEPPGGDPARGFPPPLEDGASAFFEVLNRGKRGVVADLRSSEGRASAAELIATADVVIESLGAAREALGVSYEQASADRRALVWCSISGWGRDRPDRAIDPSVQAAMGMISITGTADGPPVRIQFPLIDLMTGMYAVQQILAALWRAERDGAGALLDCAMADAAATLTSTSMLLATGGVLSPRRFGAESPLLVPGGVFATADGRQVQIICLTERHWRGLCDAVGHPEWLDDPACADNATRIAHRALVHSRLADVVAAGDAAGWVARISAAGAICEIVRDIEEAWADERLRTRGLVSESGLPVVSLARTLAPGAPLPRAPRLGEP